MRGGCVWHGGSALGGGLLVLIPLPVKSRGCSDASRPVRQGRAGRGAGGCGRVGRDTEPWVATRSRPPAWWIPGGSERWGCPAPGWGSPRGRSPGGKGGLSPEPQHCAAFLLSVRSPEQVLGHPCEGAVSHPSASVLTSFIFSSRRFFPP